MTKPQQRAARERWAARLKLIGDTLEDVARQRGPIDDRGEHKVHVSTLSRITKIPETSMRAILDESFTAIVVTGWVVGYQKNRVYLSPAEKPVPRPKVPHVQRVPACGGDRSCKTHGGGEFGADSAQECRR